MTDLKMLTAKEVSKLLSISVSCVFNYVRQGKLKPYKFSGGATRFKLSDIHELIDSVGGK